MKMVDEFGTKTIQTEIYYTNRDYSWKIICGKLFP